MEIGPFLLRGSLGLCPGPNGLRGSPAEPFSNIVYQYQMTNDKNIRPIKYAYTPRLSTSSSSEMFYLSYLRQFTLCFLEAVTSEDYVNLICSFN